MKRKFRLTEYRGFTLVEMMVSLVISSLVIASAFLTYNLHHNTFTTESQITDMQYAGSTAMDIITKDIRESGFGVPDSPNINGQTTSFDFTDAGVDSGPDSFIVLGGFRKVGEVNGAVNPGATTFEITYEPGAPTLNATTRGYITLDGLTYLDITSVSGTTITVSGSTPVDRYYPSKRCVYLIENVAYFVNGNILYRSSPTYNTANDVNGDGYGDQPIADNVDDLQLSEIDSDGDGVTDKVKVSLLARTEREVMNAVQPDAASVVLENNTTGSNDFFRRRVLQMEVSLRNPVR
ncbi:MAG: prepilin-type N-terminal cleavage/methylation domain-containing protein [Deltaproteobacteria bacterium]|nr:prepilin-type N-terminal cleavage/methylation domain-containing protein [Deltaproteobacteria bacterium]NIS78213.1 prepilin-type N-terminal cleavage/methylation domain-containing protein [Deltaproteobacteria bacterium]